MFSTLKSLIISALMISLAFIEGNAMKNDDENRAIFCENLEKGLEEEYLECYGKLSEKLRSLSSECNSKVLPSSKGEMKIVLEEGCKDKTIFDNLKKCCDEHGEVVKEELEKMKADVNVKACFDKLEEKYKGLNFWE
uniref:U17-Liphistoxin-Lth1a_1 n=1 Tax=Liphistius thaleban TaxID=1905330 RepID=A0A4Q8K6N4_9ARAC